MSINRVITIFLAVVFTMFNPNFITGYNLLSMSQSLAPYAIMTLGVLIPISMGGIDLSIGTTCIASATIAGKLYSDGMPLFGVIPVMILVGAIVGTANGLIVSKCKIQPFIVTLGSMMFVRGGSAIFAGKPQILYPSNCWYNQLFSNYNGFPTGVIWIIFFALIVYFIFRKTEYGRYFVSIGSNEQATMISGVDVDLYKCIGYIISGTFAGIAGIFWAASFATVSVATGNGMELDAIAGVYIGGTLAHGGMANVFGSAIGAVMLVVIRSGLNFALARLNISINSTYVTYAISGIVVVASVLIERKRKMRFNLQKTKKQEKKEFVTRVVSLGLSVVMVLFLVLVGTKTIAFDGIHSGSNEKTICILMKSEAADFWNDVEAGALAAGEEHGYRVICRGPKREESSFLPKQLELAESLLSEDPVGIGIATVADGFMQYLKKLNDNGIPAIQYDSGLYEEDLKNIEASDYNPLVGCVRADNYANAELAAVKTFEAVRDDIVDSKEYIVGIIQHANVETAYVRASGFADKFKQLAESDSETKGKVKVITEIKPADDSNAYKAALEYLFEKDADLIYVTANIVMNPVIDAIQASNNKYAGMKLVGYDSCERLIEWLKRSDSDEFK